ncbi:hypothetical protein ES705_07557 [subsurface metagenome]
MGNINLRQTNFAGILSALTDVNVSPSDQDVLTWDEDTSKWIAQAGAGGNVTAGATLTDERLIRGDTADKGIQTSGIQVDDSNNVTGMGTLSCGNLTAGGLNKFGPYGFMSSIYSLTCNVWGYSARGHPSDSSKLKSMSAAGSIYPQAIIMGGLGGGIKFLVTSSNPFGLDGDILIATYEKMRLDTSGNLYLYSATSKITGGTRFSLEAGAEGVCSTTIHGDTTALAANLRILALADNYIITRSTSGEKYKDKIKDLELDSSLIYDLRPRSFNSKSKHDDKNKRFIGLIADEIEQVYPEIVHYNEKHEVESYDSQMLTTLILSQLQEINKRVGKLEGVTDE